jgi:hypothetical protein
VTVSRLISTASAIAAIAIAGCGDDEPPETPVACVAPASAYLDAVKAAPGEVRLDGTTPISACLVEEQDSGALASVGESVVAAVTELNAQVLRDPDPQTIASLGYLVGAVARGAESTGGIHQDLVLRINSAARYTGEDGERLGAAFERAFGEGYSAGQATG